MSKRKQTNLSLYEWDLEILDGVFGPDGSRSQAARLIIRQWNKYNLLARAVVMQKVTEEEALDRLRSIVAGVTLVVTAQDTAIE